MTRKIESAPTLLIEKYPAECRVLLMALGKILWHDADEWTKSVFVSDESSILDFLEEDQIRELSTLLAVQVSSRALIVEVCQQLRERNARYT